MLANGNVKDLFRSLGGLHQGALSPFLFMLMVDSLSKLISRFEDMVKWLTFKLVVVG